MQKEVEVLGKHEEYTFTSRRKELEQSYQMVVVSFRVMLNIRRLLCSVSDPCSAICECSAATPYHDFQIDSPMYMMKQNNKGLSAC